MYIRHLKVEHLKRLAAFELDFTHRGAPRMWTVMIGENGTAKTTLLQAIALAAAGFREVSGLAGSAVKHLRDRRYEAPMLIDAAFAFGPQSRKGGKTIHPHMPSASEHKPAELMLQSLVRLDAGATSLEAAAFYDKQKKLRADPLAEARSLNTPLWFVAGYGISRALPDANEIPALARPSIERLEPLFRQQRLASTGFANHFLEKDRREGRRLGETSRRFSRMLNQAVKLGGDDLFPGLARLELRGQGGARSSTALIESDRFYQVMAKGQDPVAIAGVALSHGYQSTFAWIADLIGHVLLESSAESTTTEMEGLVLVDEIDLYLHPTWQARFIPALRRVFPRLQFVATTHSPVVLSTLAPHEVIRLTVDEQTGDIVQGGWARGGGQFRPGIQDAGHQPDPRIMTGGELYRTWFGLEGVTPNPLGEKLRRLQVLSVHPAPTSAQKKELRELRSTVRREFIQLLGTTEGRKAFADIEASNEGGGGTP
ncbi:AAA family ATPase [Pyxidicoccus xibeiensis]|uniref:AAA family ATPase n=1 Tax=Pyxidicoccus xibeiensis TaxID=2906759 RepID=UPI0020A7D506|nr:AAA family ATPase [Pyxidicoccus xibeiensis]MCP3142278.1 AAA family ATPase [Pyxidicoccus xibeiensis]